MLAQGTARRAVRPDRTSRPRGTWRRSPLRIAAALAWVIGVTVPARAGPPAKIAPDLLAAVQRAGANPVSVIVQTALSVGAADQSEVKQYGGRVRTVWSIIRGYAAELPAPAVARLAASANVRRISLDRTVRMTMDTTGQAVGSDIARATYNATGKNVGVAVLDSGSSPDRSSERPSAAGSISSTARARPTTITGTARTSRGSSRALARTRSAPGRPSATRDWRQEPTWSS